MSYQLAEINSSHFLPMQRVEDQRKKLALEAESAAAAEKSSLERRMRLRGHQSTDSDKEEMDVNSLVNGRTNGTRDGSTRSHTADVSMVCSTNFRDDMVPDIFPEWR